MNLRLFLMVILLGSLVPGFLLTPSARGDDLATFERVEATAIPNVQGVGGPIEVTVSAVFFGGCCYPLFAHDVAAHIELPPGLENMSRPLMDVVPDVEGTAGGAPVYVDFTWIIKGKQKGIYQVNFTVNSDCGEHSTSVMLEVIEGVPISRPQTYPLQPELGEPFRIIIESSSPVETVTVQWVKIFYVLEDSRPGGVKPANHTLGGMSGSSTEMVQGQFDPDQWSGQIPLEGKGRFLAYWFVAHDSMDRNTTSPLYVNEVFDPAMKTYTLSVVMGGMMIAILLSWVFMVRSKLPATPDSRPGLLPLGREEPITDLTGPHLERRPWEVHRDNLRLAFFGVMVVCILIGILAGYFVDYMEEVAP